MRRWPCRQSPRRYLLEGNTSQTPASFPNLDIDPPPNARLVIHPSEAGGLLRTTGRLRRGFERAPGFLAVFRTSSKPEKDRSRGGAASRFLGWAPLAPVITLKIHTRWLRFAFRRFRHRQRHRHLPRLPRATTRSRIPQCLYIASYTYMHYKKSQRALLDKNIKQLYDLRNRRILMR